MKIMDSSYIYNDKYTSVNENENDSLNSTAAPQKKLNYLQFDRLKWLEYKIERNTYQISQQFRSKQKELL